MTTGERLAGELRRAWCGSPWHGPSVREVLLRLTAQQAAFRRFRGSHTAWELLRHLTLWAEVPLRRFDDPTAVATEEQNFAPPTATRRSVSRPLPTAGGCSCPMAGTAPCSGPRPCAA